MIRSGADELVLTLREAGVEVVFGVPGSQNVALFDALERNGLRTVLATSETMAGFMAIGHFRASGKTGVFIAMPGPGFSYAIPPLAEAALDSSAILLITGQTPNRGKAFDLQSVDQTAIVSALCKDNFILNDVKSVGEASRQALRQTVRSGTRPVVAQVSRSALEQDFPAETSCAKGSGTNKSEYKLPSELDLQLRNCRRPFFFVGASALQYSDRLRSVAHEFNALLATTPAARGIIRENDWQVIPFDLLVDDVGAVNMMMEESDIIIALGSRFSHNGTGGYSMRIPTEKLVHVSPDSSVLNSNYLSKWPVCTDISGFLSALEGIHRDGALGDGDSWTKSDADRWRKQILRRQVDVEGEPTWLDIGSGCSDIFRQIRSAIPDDGILVTDTGIHQILARKYFEVRNPRGLVVPTDFQSMGFGLPAAIGAALAAPGRSVVALLGDGGFLMTMAELATIAREELPIVIIVFSDGWLGQIRMQQINCGAAEFATRLQKMRIESMADSFGIKYVRGGEDLETQIRHGLESRLPLIVETKLGDPPNFTGKRRKAQVKQRFKKVLGRRGVNYLNRLLNRGG